MLPNKKILKFLIYTFCFSVFSSISQSNVDVPLKNLVINESPKPTTSLIFEDYNGKKTNLKNYHGKLMILNFWATWCAPCKREMPSLEKLTFKYPEVKVFAINMEAPNKLRVRDFFRSVGVASLDVYYDPKLKLVKQFKMRGLPTSILINKQGMEFGRIIGEIDFVSEDFISLIKKHI